MKTETLLLLAIAGIILYEYSRQQGVKTITCGQPGSDPVFCAMLQQAEEGI